MTLKPGILSDRAIGALFGGGQLKSEVMLDKDQIQPASLDLRLGDKAFRVRASFLPGKGVPGSLRYCASSSSTASAAALSCQAADRSRSGW